MRKLRSLYLATTLILIVLCSFLAVPVFSQNSLTQEIQSHGEIIYSPAAMPQLIVNGLHLEDGSGNRVTLKGVTVDWNERMKKQGTIDMASSPSQAYFTSADVAQIKAAGGNVVELIEISTDYLMSGGSPNTSYFTNWVDVWVNWITSNQVYCLINVAAINNLSFFNLGDSGQDANRANFVNLWAYIANRYKSNPYVLFGLMNEPFNGLSVPSGSRQTYLGYYSTFMTTIVDAIRATGALQVIMIDVPFIDGKIQPVNRDNVVWESHHYIGSWSPTLSSWQNEVNYYIDTINGGFGKPLFVGEYGFDPISIIRSSTYSNSWTTLLSQMTNYLDNKKIAGRQFHTWGYLYGKYYDFDGTSDLTEEESIWVLQTLFG